MMYRTWLLCLLALCANGSIAAAQEIFETSKSQEITERVGLRLEAEFEEAGLQWGAPVFLRLFKARYAHDYRKASWLEVWVETQEEYKLFKDYPVCALMSSERGPKQEEHDTRSPEGFYEIYPESLAPWSVFHLAINIGYPNALDQALERTGDAIMIHGGCASVGCFAMTDEGIEDIYTIIEAALRAGQESIPVHIFPYLMDRTYNLDYLAEHDPWRGFRETLVPGYQFFVDNGRPPRVLVRNNHYDIRP